MPDRRSARIRLAATLRADPRKHLTAVALVLALVVSMVAAAIPGSWAKFSIAITNSVDTAGVAVANSCAWTYATGTPTPYFLYPLNENPASASVPVTDTSGNKRNGTYVGGVSHSILNACARDLDGSTTFNGSTSYAYAPTQQSSPQTFSVEIWFRTTKQGYLIGLQNTKTGAGSTYDRHLYIDSNNKLAFGVYNGTTNTVVSPNVVTDNAWHHAVGTFVSTGGMYLYLDGQSVGTPITTAITAETNAGYWRIGYGNLNSWPNPPTSYFFSGQLAYAAVYMSVLPPATVTAHYNAGV